MCKSNWSMVRLAGVVLFFQYALSTTAAAALMSVNTSFGPNTATLDSATQQRWLDLSVSRPFSYNQLVNTELNAGGQFEGYRLASTDEIEGFISNSEIFALLGTPAFDGFHDFRNMIGGVTFDFSGDGCQLAFLGVPSGMDMFGDALTAGAMNTRGLGECMTQMPTDSMNGFINTFTTGLVLRSSDFSVPLNLVDVSVFPGETTPAPVSGAWLVQDVTAVSAPSSAALVLLGLLALIRIAPATRVYGHCKT